MKTYIENILHGNKYSFIPKVFCVKLTSEDDIHLSKVGELECAWIMDLGVRYSWV